MFPFKSEDLTVVSSNLTTAARHERVDEVWAVAAAEGYVAVAVRRLYDMHEAEHRLRLPADAALRII